MKKIKLTEEQIKVLKEKMNDAKAKFSKVEINFLMNISAEQAYELDLGVFA